MLGFDRPMLFLVMQLAIQKKSLWKEGIILPSLILSFLNFFALLPARLRVQSLKKATSAILKFLKITPPLCHHHFHPQSLLFFDLFFTSTSSSFLLVAASFSICFLM